MKTVIKDLWNKSQMGYYKQTVDPDVITEFATMIVNDCIKVVDAEAGRRIGEIDIGMLIRQHFGMK